MTPNTNDEPIAALLHEATASRAGEPWPTFYARRAIDDRSRATCRAA